MALAAQAVAWANQEVGSEACRGCHAGIWAAYAKTGMARSTGTARLENAGGEPFEVFGARVQASASGTELRFDFAKPASDLAFSRGVRWFVGSGHVGRNYLYARDGFLFQLPVSYYASAARFDASPGYARKTAIELTRPVGTACLQCHASRLQPVAGTENRFASEPFLEGGVSCERCHGPGQEHVERAGKGSIVNPAKLVGDRRDSVCAQCHLTGAARIARVLAPGARRYQPGDRLSDSIAVFVRGGAAASTAATNHFEQFDASACRRKAGPAKLWCRTCHPIHGQAIEVNAVCRSCHASVSHEPANDGNCTNCHMPRTTTQMGDHVAYTNHSIARRALTGASGSGPEGELRPFGGAHYDARDLALAANTLPLLEQAAARNPRDVPVLAQLAQLYDRAGDEEKALALCERVVRLDPAQMAATVNLGGYLVKHGRAREAMALWESALRRNAGLIGARLNLAVARFRMGDRRAAEAELQTILEWEPDHAVARKMLAEVQAAQ